MTQTGGSDADDVALELLGSTDGALWAKRFVQTVREVPEIAIDEDTMLTWFANAIEAGRAAGRRGE